MKSKIVEFQVRKIFKGKAEDLDYRDSALNSIRPLCPTRWLCRSGPVTATVDNYMQLLRALSEVCSSRVLNSAEARAKDDGIFKSLAKAETFLGSIF